MKPLKLPNHWKAFRLGEICDVRYGLGQPPELAPEGVPMIRATDIKNGRIVSESVLRVRPEAIPRSKNPFLKTGDILVVRSGAYTGDVAMYDGRWQIAIAGYDLIASPAADGIDSAYLTACLLGEAVQRYFRSQRDRSAQPHLNSDQLKNAIIPIPPLPEQRAIARALRAVQDAKEARQREAALERERKAALMQHLFKHGTRGEATRQTEIGEIPKSWEVTAVEAVGKLVSGGTPNKGRADWWQGSIPWASPKDLKQPRLRNVPDRISVEGLENGSTLVPAGSIFVVVRGMILAKDVPIALAEMPMAFNQDMKAIVPKPTIVPAYLLYALTSRKDALRGRIGRSAHGTGRLGTAALAELELPLPDRAEQEEIAGILRACEDRASALTREAALLDELFRALLEELMTGRLSAVPLIDG